MFMSFRRLRVVVLVVMYMVLAGSVTSRVDSTQTGDQEEQRIRRNKYGAVIKDARGNRINYTKEQLMVQKERWKGVTAKSEYLPRMRTSHKAYAADVRWYYGSFGSEMGCSNLIVAENGSHNEIYLGGSTSTWGGNDYWYVLKYNTAKDEYSHMFISSYFTERIQRLEIADVAYGSDKEIVVALEDGSIHLYDQVSKEWLNEFNTAADGLEGLEIADVDSDGENELILTTYDHLYIYSGDGSLEWDIANVGGNDVIVGQMDEDSTLEIAVTDGNIIDVSTQSVQWTWPYQFGSILEAADIDSDNMDELIVAESWYLVWAYDVNSELPKWSIPFGGDIDAINVTDIDNDSVQELLVGEGQWGDILCFNTVDQTLEWSGRNPDHGVADIAVADVDSDGNTEVLWCAGATSSGEDHMYIADWQAKKLEWRSRHLDGPFIGPKIGDLDGDGNEEIVAIGGDRILVFKKTSPLPYAISDQVSNGLAFGGTHDISLHDVDKDGRMEILVATSNLYEGVVEIYDFSNSGDFSLNWTNTTQPECSPFYSVRAADVDDDGELEITAGAGGRNCGDGGVYIYVYDYNTSVEEWHSLQMGDLWDNIIGLEIFDIDDDGVEEIVGLIDTGPVYIFDGISKILEDILFGDFTALKIIEWKNSPLILLGDENGDVSAYSYTSGVYTKIIQQNFLPGRIDGISIGPQGTNQFFIGSEGTLSAVNPGGIVWQSSSYGEIFGKHTGVMSAPQCFVSAGSYAILAFKYNF